MVDCPSCAAKDTELTLLRGQREEMRKEALVWAIERWNAEVANRPLVNVHRPTLDDTWRQVIRYFGGDPGELVGLSHDALPGLAEAALSRQEAVLRAADAVPQEPEP